MAAGERQLIIKMKRGRALDNMLKKLNSAAAKAGEKGERARHYEIEEGDDGEVSLYWVSDE